MAKLKRLQIFCIFSLTIFITIMSAPMADAVLTRKWVDEGYGAFLKGETTDLKLTADGGLGLAPAIKKIAGPSLDSSILTIYSDQKTVYGGTCFGGKVLVRRPEAKSFTVFAETKEIMVTAIISHGKSLFVGTGPNGKIFEYDKKSKKLLNTHDSGENYIWAFLRENIGTGLLVATGPNGRLLALRNGKFTVRYDSKSKHINCLARSKEGNVLAGTADEALLLDLASDGSGPARTLFQPNQPECRSISVDERTGTIYLCATTAPKAAASLKKPMARKPAPRSAKKNAKKDDKKKSITEETNNNGAEAVATKKGNGKKEAPKKEEPKSKTNKVQPKLSAKGEAAIRRFLEKVAVTKPFQSKAPAGKKVAFTDGAKHNKHAIYAIEPNGSASTIFSSNDAVVFGAVFHRGRLYVGSGNDGYVYRVNPKKNGAELLAHIDEKQAVAFGVAGDELIIGSGNEGRFYSVGPESATTGTFTSEVKKLPHNALFGSISHLSDNPQGAKLSFETRSGFTVKPDDSWSPWTACDSTVDQWAVNSTCPPGRFFQYRVHITRTEEDTAPFALRRVEAFYRPFNLAPRIQTIQVQRPAVRLSSNRRELSIAASGKGSKGKKSMKPYMRSVKWKVADPNGDKVLSTVYLRLEGEREWEKITDDELDGTAIVWETLSIPDGTYRLKVVVNDSPANFSSEVKSCSRVSSAFTVDNSAPEITALTAVVKKGRKLHISGTARDSASRILNVEYSLNGDYYKALGPKDGLFDSSQEDFTAVIKLKRGKPARSIAVKAFDEYGNITNERIFIRKGSGSLKR